jgi:putative spermidine/putrescine transport system ATP-binding protein
MNQLELLSINKTYGGAEFAVEDLNLAVKPGEFFSILGPSGCGKSTTLRMIAGFVSPTSGQIALEGQDVTRQPPEKRRIGIVFQNYAVFPHMTVGQNIAYGLKLRGVGKAVIAETVRKALAQVNLSGYEDRRPNNLSGGEQQRVALARVIVLEPSLLLLDEPLSALDKKLRDEMRSWLKRLQADLGITTVYVTHDQDEALSLSDRIAVMSKGVVQQVGTPDEVYERPATRFVADFIGESNIWRAKPETRTPDGVVLEIDGLRCVSRAEVPVAHDLMLMVRPEQVLLGVPEDDAFNRFSAVLDEVAYHGSIIRFVALLEGRVRIRGELPNLLPARLARGEPVTVGWRKDHGIILPAQ